MHFIKTKYRTAHRMVIQPIRRFNLRIALLYDFSFCILKFKSKFSIFFMQLKVTFLNNLSPLACNLIHVSLKLFENLSLDLPSHLYLCLQVFFSFFTCCKLTFKSVDLLQVRIVNRFYCDVILVFKMLAK